MHCRWAHSQKEKSAASISNIVEQVPQDNLNLCMSSFCNKGFTQPAVNYQLYKMLPNIGTRGIPKGPVRGCLPLKSPIPLNFSVRTPIPLALYHAQMLRWRTLIQVHRASSTSCCSFRPMMVWKNHSILGALDLTWFIEIAKIFRKSLVQFLQYNYRLLRVALDFECKLATEMPVNLTLIPSGQDTTQKTGSPWNTYLKEMVKYIIVHIPAKTSVSRHHYPCLGLVAEGTCRLWTRMCQATLNLISCCYSLLLYVSALRPQCSSTIDTEAKI